MLSPRLAQGPMTDQQARQLTLVETAEDLRESLAASLNDGGEHRGRRRSGMDDDHPSIVGVVPALDEPAPLHPVDDARRARDGNLEELCETAHGQRTVRIELVQDVEMDEAQRALVHL